MNKSTKMILILIIGFAIMFATSFLLDLEIIQNNPIRKILTYLLVILEFILIIISGRNTSKIQSE